MPIQYVDFAAWQRNWLPGEILETQISYWLKQLANIPKVLELPTDRPRPATQTFKGANYSFELTPPLSAALNRLSQQQGTTLFMTLLAGFQTLLWRYTAQEDIVVGSPIANRNRGETEGLIGFFVNTLVLRSNLAGNPSFEELLKQVREVSLGAYAHQDLPFELLVERLQPERDLSHAPLFQVMFVLQNAPISELELPGLTLSTLESESETSKFDLTLYMTETESGLSASFEYNTDLFEPATISRMVGHLETLLSAIVANPQQKLSELSFLTEPERQQLLSLGNNTQVDYPQDQSIDRLFEAQVEKTPDAVAVVFEDEALTYRELNQKANQVAHYLQSLDVDSGVLVGICLEPSIEQVVSLLGILKASGVYVPLDPNYPSERLAFMLEDSNVQIILTRQSLIENLAPQQTHLTLDDLAYAIYTSGSTGRPKAVLGKLRGIVNRLHWMWSALPFTADEVCCQKTSINFVDHVAEIFSPLLKGIPLVIVPDKIRSDVSQLMSLLGEREITRIVLVPSLLKVMLDSTPPELLQLQSLKYVFCSGEALPLNLAEAFYQQLSSARLFNIYGSSEVAADVTCFEVNFWETRQKILQYFKPEVVRGTPKDRVLGVYQKPFTQPGVSPETLATKFQQSELPLYPVTVDDYQDKFAREVLPYTIDTASPTFIGHMTSALPDFMHDMSKMISRLNQNLVKIETSKSLIFLEREAIAMLHRLVYDLSREFYAENIQQKNRNLGIVTTGGTTANISALLCARNSGLLSPQNSGELSKVSLYKVLSQKGYDDIVILGSRLMHYSVSKAASILGMGTDNIVFIDNDDEGNLDLHRLREKICECQNNRLYILALVGIAGTTETGEIDPLWEMGEIAQEFGIHFHVDGAWGGATMFSDKHKVKLKGIEQADSLTICGHKQLYLPQGISVCLFKDPQILNSAATTARYQAQKDTFDVGRFTIEGSRSAISLCLHGTLHIIGKRGYEILINNGIEKAQYFAQLIELLEPFELLVQPALNIVNYRYIPDDLSKKARQKCLSNDDLHRINQLNAQIQREQFERGMTFVSKTTLMDGKNREIVVFRTVLSNPNTTATDLQTVLEDQLRIANQIETRSQDVSDSIANLPIQAIGSDDLKTAIVQQEAIHLRLADNLQADLAEYLSKNTIPIGKPIANTQIYILDKYGSLLPSGIAGELYVGGDALAQGYLNLPELTQEKFVPNLLAIDSSKTEKSQEERLYRTGDLARWLADGNLEFLGRIDHQVKIRGFRIELGEIAAAIAQHSAVREAVVAVTEELPDSKRLVAYVVTQDEPGLTISQLREFLISKLPNYMIPSALVRLAALPLNPNGKVDRQALPAPDLNSSELEGILLEPRTPTEEILVNIWQEVLNVSQIGVKDNFFNLGGHSLLATRLISRVKRVFKTELPLRSLFENPTVASLAKCIQTDSNSSLQSEIKSISRAQKLPLSFAQQRLWFLAQLEPDSPNYNLPVALSLKGKLNVAVLEASFSQIVERHEVLRTSFVEVDGSARQIITPSLKVDLAVIEPETRWDKKQVQATIKSLALKPFDLSKAPLFRVKLIRLNAEEHILVFVIHHIISDRWSQEVLVQEFALLYESKIKTQSAFLPELPIQYADFSIWQRQHLQAAVLNEHLDYWQQQLQGNLPVLEFSSRSSKLTSVSHRGAVYNFTLDRELSDRLQTFSRQENCTLFITLLTIFKVLLAIETRQEDIIVGSPIANRDRLELEPLIGFFVNTLLLRTNLAGKPTFRELLERVREVTLNGYAHQALPFEKLVEVLQPDRQQNSLPFLKVWFTLTNEEKDFTLPDLTIEGIKLDTEIQRYQLRLDLAESSAGLKGSFGYKTDIFTADEIAFMAKSLETILRLVISDPDLDLTELAAIIVRAKQEERIIREQELTQTSSQKLKNIRRRVIK